MCITKKRYVGMMYEGPQQQEPTFDAKGIETVRRDTCPAVAKTMERSLRILFASRDLSQVLHPLAADVLWLPSRALAQLLAFCSEIMQT